MKLCAIQLLIFSISIINFLQIKNTLFLKENTIDTWKLIENAENLEFHANNNTINSAILKQISTFLEEGFFDSYIQRYEYEMNCFDIGNDLIERERLNAS